MSTKLKRPLTYSSGHCQNDPLDNKTPQGKCYQIL